MKTGLQVVYVTKIQKNLYEVIINKKELSLFNTALSLTNLISLIEDENSEYTIFAPNNKDFENIGEQKLDSILKNNELLEQIIKLHIIPGKIKSTDLNEGQTTINTLGGEVNINKENNRGCQGWK